MKIKPCLRIIFYKGTLLNLLANSEESTDVGVLTTFEILEIGLIQETHIIGKLMLVTLSAKNILLLQTIAFTQCLNDIAKNIGIPIV